MHIASRAQHVAVERQEREMIAMVAPSLSRAEVDDPPLGRPGIRVFHNERPGADWFFAYPWLDPERQS